MIVMQNSLEEFLRAVLRGAAKILGCSSTNLILFNERSQEIRVQIGAKAASYPILEEVELAFGKHFKNISFPIESAQGSMVYRSWHDRRIYETSSLSSLLGNTFPPTAVEHVAKIIGEHRFICVPALSNNCNYGVLLFEKEGKHPFSRQQREVILRYAQRIGEIIENDLMGQGRSLVSSRLKNGQEFYLFSEEGDLCGYGPTGEQNGLSDAQRPELISFLRDRLMTLMEENLSFKEELPSDTTGIDQRMAVSCYRLQGKDNPLMLCALRRGAGRPDASFENQLLQLTLGEPAPTLFIDPDLTITSCNDAAAQLFGVSPKEMRHRSVKNFFCNPLELTHFLGQNEALTLHPSCENSTLILRKDGTVAEVEVEALFLADEMHQGVGYLMVIREKSETKSEGVKRLVDQERLATMGEMATQLAHEIRNPLLAIGATLESLSRDILNEEHQATLTLVKREIGRLDMILKDYLAAKHDVSFSNVQLTEVLNDARLLLEGARLKARRTIAIDVAPDLFVKADYDALKHLFFNLLLNALEAGGDGEVITCLAIPKEHDVRIQIDDRGSGLKHRSEDCFRPFFTTKKNGTGLGLSVCQKIARAHGGAVTLKSRDGGGCRAQVILPRFDERRGKTHGPH